MRSQLLFYQNELKNREVQSYKLIGIVAEMIYSKKLFPTNKELFPFVNALFALETPIKSCKDRPTLVAKVTKGMVSQTYHLDKKVLQDMVSEKLADSASDMQIPKAKKSRKKRDALDGWLK